MAVQIHAVSLQQERAEEIAHIFQPIEHVIEAKVFYLDSLLHFFPSDGRRYRGAWLRPDGINRREGSAPSVLVVIDQNVARGPPGDLVFGGDDFGMGAFQFLRERLREGPDLFLERAALDGNVDVYASRSSRLRKTRNLQFGERVTYEEGDFEDLFEIRLRSGIEIEVEKIGAICIVAAGVPGVQVDTAEVDYPKQSREILNHGEFHEVRGGMRDRADGNPLGPRVGGAFLKEERPGGSVWVTLHDHGAVGEMGQEERRNIGVVLKQMMLGDAVFGPEHLLKIGETDLLSAESELHIRLIRRDLKRLGMPGQLRIWTYPSLSGSSRRRGASQSALATAFFLRWLFTFPPVPDLREPCL